MNFIDLITLTLLLIGLFFFFSGSIGLIRFPDLICRIHALTKADNVGLAFIALGVAIYSRDWLIVLKVLFIWFFILFTSSLMSLIIAQRIQTDTSFHADKNLNDK